MTTFTPSQLRRMADDYALSAADYGFDVRIPNALHRASDDAENLSAAKFIAYLIDNHEGETVSEYMLQIWLDDAMTATRTPKEQTK